MAEPSGSPAETDLGQPVGAPPRRRRHTGAVAAVIGEIPDRITVFALCAAVSTAISVQLSLFHPYVVLPLFLVLVAATWGLAPARMSAGRARLIGVAVAFLLMLVWIALQWRFFSEQVGIARDPGIYTVRGFWLMNHPSPDVRLSDHLLALKEAFPAINIDFGTDTGRSVRYLQSTTVVPGLIAIGGWIGGPSLLMKSDILIGAAGLMAVYAAARRLAGPLFGLLPMVALAASMPMVAFARVAYTEPLSLIAVMACLLGLMQGVREGRAAMWFLAGVGAGGVALTRIDGWLVVIGGAVGFGIWGAFALSKAAKRRVLAGLGWFTLAALLVGGLGLTDLLFHSPDYLRALKSSAVPLMVLTPIALLLAAALTVLPGLPAVARWLAGHAPIVASVLIAVLGVVMVVMLLRPLFLVAQLTSNKAGQAANIARQTAEGLDLEPVRSYDEMSLTWISWYLGWPAVILGCLAGLYAVQLAVRRRRVDLLLMLAVVAVNAALYLNIVSITPDQIWAMRRFLPVILPGGLMLVGWLLREAYRSRAGGGRLLGRMVPAVRTRVVTAVVGLLVAAVAVFPVAVWRSGLFTVKEWAGQYDLVQQVCTEVGHQKVLMVGNNPTTGYYQPTLRALCGSEVITMPESTPALIAKVGAEWTTDPIRVVSFYSTGVSWTSDPGPPNFSNVMSAWESVISHRPARPFRLVTNVWIGTARADGTVDPD